MSKRVFLFVSGEEYSALLFVQNFNPQEVYENMVKENKRSISIDHDGFDIHVTIKEFNEIDPKFIEFIQSEVIDYDHTKHKDFIEVQPVTKHEKNTTKQVV